MKTKTILLSILCFVGITTATAQSNVWVWKGGRPVKTEMADSITFTAPASENPQVDEPTEVDEPTGPARDLAEASTEDIGMIIGEDGKIYDTKKHAEAAGTTAVAMIAYVGSDTDHADYKNGLAIALSDESESNWSTAKSACEGKANPPGSKWVLPSRNQWRAMFKATGGSDSSYSGLNEKLSSAGCDSSKLQEYGSYWSSTEFSPGYSAYYVSIRVGGDAYFIFGDLDIINLARPCLAF